MDILAIRDDGNDPLRPTIANACDWIEQARLDGGKVLVHCVCPTEQPTSYTNMLTLLACRRQQERQYRRKLVRVLDQPSQLTPADRIHDAAPPHVSDGRLPHDPRQTTQRSVASESRVSRCKLTPTQSSSSPISDFSTSFSGGKSSWPDARTKSASVRNSSTARKT